MSAITFPSSPYTNQIYTVGSKSWQWDGSVWAAYYNEGVDSVYGTGADGDATLDGTTTVLSMAPSASVYTMTRDMFFNDLTINTSVRLAPNGYRIFVKGVLKFMGTNSTIGYTTGYSTAGSIAQGGAAATSVTHSLGGAGISSPAGTNYTVTAPTAAMGGSTYFQVPHQAITGYSITASGGPTFLRGGAGGTGQAGGGVVIIAARYISPPASGTAYIKAPATAPAGGGVILIVSSGSSLPSGISTVVTGQNAGTYYYMQQV
jgi:hypothetical protein